MSTPVGRRWSPLRVVGSGTVVAGALALVAWLPQHSGSSWTEVARVVGDVPLPLLAALVTLWLAGLVASSFALSACLPGLTVRRALTLSLTGSAVANVLPLGGGAGVGLNYAMARSWGHRSGAFAAYTVVTNLVDVATKVAVVAAAATVVLASGHEALPGSLAPVALGVAAAVLLTASLVLRAPVARAVGRRVDDLVARLGRLAGRPLRSRLDERLPEVAGSSLALLRRAWVRVVAGSTGYAFLQAVLLAWCLRACGVHVSLALVAATYATDRLLTLVPLTPGGVGLVETGLLAAVLAWGVPSGPALAGVLLYRALTYAAEVPVGGALLLGWLVAQAARRRLDAVPRPLVTDPLA